MRRVRETVSSAGGGNTDKQRSDESSTVIALLNNIKCNHDTDERAGRRELRVYDLLTEVRQYCQQLSSSTPAVVKHLSVSSAVAALEKLSSEKDYLEPICSLGSVETLADLIRDDTKYYGVGEGTSVAQWRLLMRKHACLALNNLTCGDASNKALLCNRPAWLSSLILQLKAPCEDLRQVAATVLHNLSGCADAVSKEALRECGAVTALINAALHPLTLQPASDLLSGDSGDSVEIALRSMKELTLKSLLGALWNLSVHSSENKAEICSMPGALDLIALTLTYRSGGGSVSVVENGGGILRMISSHVALREEYRLTLRTRGCLQTLLKHLESPSNTIVINACGTLWNLSGRCATDQRLLRDLGAMTSLKNLIHSKNLLIAMGSAAVLKNLICGPTGGSNGSCCVDKNGGSYVANSSGRPSYTALRSGGFLDDFVSDQPTNFSLKFAEEEVDEIVTGPGLGCEHKTDAGLESDRSGVGVSQCRALIGEVMYDGKMSSETLRGAAQPVGSVSGSGNKTVTFDMEHIEDITPMMFSRCSSLCSLSSFDAHSVHSSVMSEYSRLPSEIGSPSELLHSPCDTVPSSPPPTGRPVRRGEGHRSGGRGRALSTTVYQSDTQGSVQERDEREKEIKHQPNDSTFSVICKPNGSSVPALTLNDDDMSVNQWSQKDEELTGGGDSLRCFATEDTPLNRSRAGSPPSHTAGGRGARQAVSGHDLRASTTSSQLLHGNNMDREMNCSEQGGLSSLSDSAENYEMLLSEVISAAMPKAERSSTSSGRGVDSFIGFAVEGTPITFSQSTSLSNLTVDSEDISNGKACDWQQGKSYTSRAMEASDRGALLEDSMHRYCVEDTPAPLSRSDSLGSINGCNYRKTVLFQSRTQGVPLYMSGSTSTPLCNYSFVRPHNVLPYTFSPAADDVISYAVEGTPARIGSPCSDRLGPSLIGNPLTALNLESVMLEPSEAALLEECINSALPRSCRHRAAAIGSPCSGGLGLGLIGSPLSTLSMESVLDPSEAALLEELIKSALPKSRRNKVTALGGAPGRAVDKPAANRNRSDANTCTSGGATNHPSLQQVIPLVKTSVFTRDAADSISEEDSHSGPSTEANNTVIYHGPEPVLASLLNTTSEHCLGESCVELSVSVTVLEEQIVVPLVGLNVVHSALEALDERLGSNGETRSPGSSSNGCRGSDQLEVAVNDTTEKSTGGREKVSVDEPGAINTSPSKLLSSSQTNVSHHSVTSCTLSASSSHQPRRNLLGVIASLWRRDKKEKQKHDQAAWVAGIVAAEQKQELHDISENRRERSSSKTSEGKIKIEVKKASIRNKRTKSQTKDAEKVNKVAEGKHDAKRKSLNIFCKPFSISRSSRKSLGVIKVDLSVLPKMATLSMSRCLENS